MPQNKSNMYNVYFNDSHTGRRRYIKITAESERDAVVEAFLNHKECYYILGAERVFTPYRQARNV